MRVTDSTDRLDLDGGAQVIVINPSCRHQGDPPGGALAPNIVQSRIRISLLIEMANAATREQFDAIDERAENGDIDDEASRLEPGPAETLLLGLFP